MMSITMRPARMSDSDMLLAWRNDPATCAALRSTTAVSPEQHDSWMRFNVGMGYPAHIVYVGENDGDPVGCVRLDMVKDDVLVYATSVMVAPEHRDSDLGLLMLSATCEMFNEFTLTAEIKVRNKRSRDLFETCGFKEAKRSTGFVEYRKEPIA